MFVSKVLSRASRNGCHSSSLLLSASSPLRFQSNQFQSLVRGIPITSSKFAPAQASLLHHSTFISSFFQRVGISSSVFTYSNEKEQGSATQGNADSTNTELKKGGDVKVSGEIKDSFSEQTEGDQSSKSGSVSETQSTTSQSKRRRPYTKRTTFSDSDSESDDELSMDDLVKLVEEKEEQLKLKHGEIEKMQDKILRSYAEMENTMDRTRREAENAKKFAIQNFAKGLLDVADNLGRASSIVKESFSKIDSSEDSSGAVPLLKTLLEGVEMTEKQLGEVFKKFGVEKFDPTNEPFDPHRHNAVFQIPDGSKPPGTVAVILKSGYMLYDRVLRPAEVGVSQAVKSAADENKETSTSDKDSQA